MNATTQQLSECLKENGLPRAMEVVGEALLKSPLSEKYKQDVAKMFECGYRACLEDLANMEVS